jgi:TnpA family transposase
LKRNWELDELIEYFTFMPKEYQAIGNKSSETRLGFAVMFKFFQNELRFPYRKNEVPKAVVEYIAKQLNIDSTIYASYDWNNRSATYHRSQIREFFEFHEITHDDIENLKNWLNKYVLVYDHDIDYIREKSFYRLRELKVEPPAQAHLERIIQSSIKSYEDKFLNETFNCLPTETLTKIDTLIDSLVIQDNGEDEITSEINDSITFSMLKSEPGSISVKSVFKEVAKLRAMKKLGLPENLFQDTSGKILKKYRQRVVTQDIRELRRHPAPIRYTLLCSYQWFRHMEVTDNLIKLLISIVHKIYVRAEKKVAKEILNEVKKVSGKYNILCKLAEASINNPEGIVKKVIFPIIGEETLKKLIKELKNTSSEYKYKVQTVIKSSYEHHYKRMVPEILDVLEFRSNNNIHYPVLRAMELLKKYAGSKIRYYTSNDKIPVEGVIKPSMKEIIIEKGSKGNEKVNRSNYEICVLQALREKLRCKEIWIIGANRYRNPDEDLPSDFEQHRVENYKAINQPLNPDNFIETLKKDMHSGLEKLDKNIPKNHKVNIKTRNGKGWISLSPSDSQPEPQNLLKLKSELMRRWPMISLLDILKETDIRVDFTKHFKTSAVREVLNRKTIQKRILLSLYSLGTNAGMKRITSGDSSETYKDILYIRRKFINKDNLRNAIAEVSNAIFNSRSPEIWGEGTTTCASDSKRVSAYDQNLRTEWHVRYRGRGVMIYWHVEKHSACIYSQLKSPSSSEVSSMLEGILKHRTNAEIEKIFTDSHGQSEVGFAFCHILGFNLMPRLKAIHSQKLYRPDTGISEAYPNLQPVLTRNINWDLIRQQYDQMVKYATALRLGTAETEAILRRFTRNNLKHPTYQALCELGKAVKTIFLCDYLDSEALRIEINEGLNVIENWNSANGFIFYGKGREITTNNIEDQEVTALSLHLLQNCLVYINTLMLQKVLSESKWLNIMTSEDFRGLTPLVYAHVNPYGSFKLNMEERIVIGGDEK